MRVLFAICMVIAETENNSNENLSRRKFADKEKFCCGCERKGSRGKWKCQKKIARRRRRTVDEESCKYAFDDSNIVLVSSENGDENHNPMREDCRRLLS